MAFVQLDKSIFVEKKKVIGIRLPLKQIGPISKRLSGSVMAIPRFKPIVADGDSEATKLLLLKDSFTEIDLSQLPAEHREFILTHDPPLDRVWHEVTFDYDFFSAEEILRRLLPVTESEIPSSFETVGHIAHLNLRDALLPYKYAIGQVLLDKNPNLRTVINKTSEIKNEFRVFPMEVLAGDTNLETEVRQDGVVFRLNYGEVYWNSRLQAEHTRLVELYMKKGDIICDMFAGIGPFAIPAAKKGCIVYANDLNPQSAHWCGVNAKLNKVDKLVTVSCADARDFIRNKAKEGIKFHHAIMNLPALGLEFLDAFIGIDPELARPLPMVHTYCFSRAEDTVADVIERATAIMGAAPTNPTVHHVRNVAPRKEMMCISFVLPAEVAQGKVNPTKAPDSDDRNPPASKRVKEDQQQPSTQLRKTNQMEKVSKCIPYY